MIKTFEQFSTPVRGKMLFAVINTADYNDNGVGAVQTAVGLEECGEYGWDPTDTGINLRANKVMSVEELEVGDIIESDIYEGAFLMRLS